MASCPWRDYSPKGDGNMYPLFQCNMLGTKPCNCQRWDIWLPLLEAQGINARAESVLCCIGNDEGRGRGGEPSTEGTAWAKVTKQAVAWFGGGGRGMNKKFRIIEAQSSGLGRRQERRWRHNWGLADGGLRLSPGGGRARISSRFILVIRPIL